VFRSQEWQVVVGPLHRVAAFDPLTTVLLDVQEELESPPGFTLVNYVGCCAVDDRLPAAQDLGQALAKVRARLAYVTAGHCPQTVYVACLFGASRSALVASLLIEHLTSASPDPESRAVTPWADALAVIRTRRPGTTALDVVKLHGAFMQAVISKASEMDT
jgi:hypothetical protein